MNRDHPERLLVYGAGGHAKSVIGAIESSEHYRISALVDDRVEEKGKKVMGHTVLGGAEVLPKMFAAGTRTAIVTIGNNADRAKLSNMLTGMGFGLANVRHPLAWVAPGNSIGPGCFIHVYAVVGPECHIGRGSIISAQAIIGHDSRIGDWVHLAPGVHLGGNVCVGEAAFLGMGCAILPQVRVGKHASVGANSVVHKDIPDGAVVAGNPARLLKSA